MTCAEVQAAAGGLASLGPGAPEADAASAHAATCAECRAVLAQANRMMTLLDGAPALPAPSQSALARTAAAVLAEMDAELDVARSESATVVLAASRGTPGPIRATTGTPARAGLGPASARGGWPWLAGALILGSTFAILLARRGLRGGRAAWLVTAAVTGFSVLCLALVPTGVWGALAAVATSTGFALWAGLGQGGGLETAVGVACVASELMTALLPTAAAVWLVRRGSAPGRASWYAGVASAGALAGHAHLHMHCPVHTSLSHLLVFHAGGVLLAAGLAAALSRLPALQARPRP